MLSAILLLAILIVINGVFAMSELAMMTSRQSRLQQSATAGSKGAAAALALARQPTRFLSTVQVGITLIGILAGAVGESTLAETFQATFEQVPLIAKYAQSASLAMVVLVITYFSLVVGELVPKRIAMAHPEFIASLISRPLNLLSIVASWPVRILTFSTEVVLRVLRIAPRQGDDVSEEDVKALIARAASTGIFTPQEIKLFQRTMRVGDLVVRDLMVSRTNIIWIDEDEPIEKVRILVGTSPHSHFPVCNGSLDRLTGVVHIKDLISYGLLSGTDFKVTAVAQKPMFVPQSMPALRLLDLFQSTRKHFAIVVDEYGGTMGLLTLNDVTSAIIGDIDRGADAGHATMTRRGEGVWMVDGHLALHEFLLILDLPAPEDLPDVSTVAGLITASLGHIPREGETLQWKGWLFEIIDMDGTRIDKVLLKRC